MENSTIIRAKRNILTSLVGQIITLMCGFITPHVMISTFGSEAYGATASISQFLAYISLLDAGITGVARAALYKPLAEQNNVVVSGIVSELQQFMRTIAYVFLAYALLLACGFKRITNNESLDWWTTFLLVIVIGLSTFAQYYLGITCSVLINATQRNYVNTTISILTTVLNTILTLILVNCGYGLIFVKLISSLVFILRPLALQFYVKRTFALTKVTDRNKKLLEQKWTGLGQHIAFFLHSNTDIMILTVFANLSLVSVYSVYNMIVSHIQSLTASFSSGMEALFGEMIAKEEFESLNKTFDKYETLISVVSVIMLSVTAVMIMPFIGLYTAGITDANYWEPVFALILILASLCYCLRMPYHAAVIAAGHFKQTRVAAYGEAILNIVSSILLVNRLGLLGVAIGTLAATAFRFVYYVWYLSKNIACRNVKKFAKRSLVNAVAFIGTVFTGNSVVSLIHIDNYLVWASCGVLSGILAVVIILGFNYLFYRRELVAILGMIVRRK